MNIRTPDEERSFTFQYALLANKAAQILHKLKNNRTLSEDDKHKLSFIAKFLENTLSAYEFWRCLARNDRIAAIKPSEEEWNDHEAFSTIARQLPDLLPGQCYDPRNARELNFLCRITNSIAKRQKLDTSVEVTEGLTQAIAFFRKMSDEMRKRYETANERCAEFDDAC